MDFFVSSAKTPVNRPLWAQKNLLMADYYDNFWGFPIHDDSQLFEMLTLEVFQAGLTWQTVWCKREAFRHAFSNYDIFAVAGFDNQDIVRLVTDKTIIRNRAKIVATINNARAVRQILVNGQSLDDYLWSQFNYRSLKIKPDCEGKLKPTIPEAKALAKKMAQDGFCRLGPVTTFSFMCAIGIVNGRLDNGLVPIH